VTWTSEWRITDIALALWIRAARKLADDRIREEEDWWRLGVHVAERSGSGVPDDLLRNNSKAQTGVASSKGLCPIFIKSPRLLKIGPNAKHNHHSQIQKIISIAERSSVNAPRKSANSQSEHSHRVAPSDCALNTEARCCESEANHQKQ
jgi:hypothetical protein